MLVLLPLSLATEGEKLAYAQGAVTVSAAVREVVVKAAEAAQCSERDVLLPGAMVLEGLLALMETIHEGGPVFAAGVLDVSTTTARITPGDLLRLAAEVVDDDDFTGGNSSGHPIDALAVASAALECVAITLYRWEPPK